MPEVFVLNQTKCAACGGALGPSTIYWEGDKYCCGDCLIKGKTDGPSQSRDHGRRHDTGREERRKHKHKDRLDHKRSRAAAKGRWKFNTKKAAAFGGADEEEERG